MTTEELKEKSEIDLKCLAVELAENYFDNASIDVYPEQRDEKNKKEKDDCNDLKRKVLHEVSDNENLDESPKARRNILIIGAGATYNAFKNIPLGGQAITEIHKKLIIISKEEEPTLIEDIDFDFFLKYFKHHVIDQEDYKYKGNKKIGSNKKKSYLDKIFVLNPDKSDFQERTKLHHLYTLGKNYYEESDRLKLYSSDYRKSDYLDFESSLNILVKLFGLKTIRQLIQNLYDYKYGETLFYQIVSHLFKNGFIDVIINFNFDELLDDAILDEMGKDSYDYIFSDGDCKDISELEKDQRLRQPLYIKPHGTASYKSSMKFTKDHYYELSSDMKTLLEQVISSRESKPESLKYRTSNIITVGFAMESLEFNEILKNHLPQGSNIFTFFNHDKAYEAIKIKEDIDKKEAQLQRIFQNVKEEKSIIDDGIVKKYEDELFELKKREDYERLELVLKELTTNDNKPVFKFIGHEFYSHLDGQVEYTSLASVFMKLYEKIQDLFEIEFKPAKINRHKIIGLLFGNPLAWETFNKKYNRINNAKTKKNDIKYKRSEYTDYPMYFNTSHYFEDRVKVECLIEIATNRGFINVVSSMRGIIGKYYALYYNRYKIENEDQKPNSIIEILQKLMGNNSIKGLEIKPLDVSRPDQYFSNNFMEIDEAMVIRIMKAFRPKIFSIYLQHYINTKLPKKIEYESFKGIKKINVIQNELREIYYSNSTKIRPKFRSTVHYAFSEYDTKDLITSSLLNNLYFQTAIDKKSETIYAIVDYGHQLKTFWEKLSDSNISNISKIRLVVQYNFNRKNRPSFDKIRKQVIQRITGCSNKITDEDNDEIEKMFDIYFLPIRRHNHHMTLFLDESKFLSKPDSFFKDVSVENYDMNGFNFNDFKKDKKDVIQSAVYYYKMGLSVNINPIRIRVGLNQQYLIEKFLTYVIKAREFESEV